jgi:hypothetical protein
MDTINIGKLEQFLKEVSIGDMVEVELVEARSFQRHELDYAPSHGTAFVLPESVVEGRGLEVVRTMTGTYEGFGTGNPGIALSKKDRKRRDIKFLFERKYGSQISDEDIKRITRITPPTEEYIINS